MNREHADYIPSKKMSRRDFVQHSSAALMASSALAGGALNLAGVTGASKGVPEASLEGRIYKTLKIGMVKVPGSLTDKFAAAKEAGFAGIEMNSPGMDVEATRLAIKESGLPVDGTVCSTHWNKTHTSADKKVLF